MCGSDPRDSGVRAPGSPAPPPGHAAPREPLLPSDRSSVLVTPALHLTAFGGFALASDEGPLGAAAAQRRPLAVLALLAAAGETGMSREKILGLLWPDAEPERGRRTLTQTLYSLRRATGADELFLGVTDVRLNPAAVECDVLAFDAAIRQGRLAEAVELYRGPFLDGFQVPGADEFERWAEAERTRLARGYAKALEELARERAAAGDTLGAVEWWRRLAGHDPFNSRIALRLVEALEAAGDRAGALRHAQAHAEAVRRELGVEPDPQIIAMTDGLRSAAAEAKPSGLSPERKFVAETAPLLNSPVAQSPPDLAAPPSSRPAARARRKAGRAVVIAGVIVALILATISGGWDRVLGLMGLGETSGATPARTPVVVLMDSPHPSRVYDQEVIEASGTNADVLNDILRDLPVQRVKEAAGPYWHRHEEIRQLQPDLVIIHFSAFCREVCEQDRIQMRRFLEYLGDTKTHFLIYSRMPPAILAENMKDMLGDLPERYPGLPARIHLFALRRYGSLSWKDPATAAAFKLQVKGLLGMAKDSPS
jgi:DNA-binding SARP family transcriptional activator